ncbi:amino acid adenylation domain-containing protein [Plantactinospora sp. DSM 117369]
MSLQAEQAPAGLIHEAFETQVGRSPTATALVVNRDRFSYTDLDIRAERVASALRARGVGRGDLVGVCLPRTAWLVPALLGVLKSGAAYVPLDPGYPADRLRLITEDARLRLVVCDESSTALAATAGVGLLDVAELPAEPVRRRVGGGPDDLAYVLYTSGSTGRPKGVPLAHRNTMAFLRWAASAYGPDELRGSLAGASVCFDFSVLEIFAPLVTGGTVILAETVFALPDLPARDEVTMLCGPPSALSVLLGRALPAGVRTVTFGGEVLTSALCARAYANPGLRRVVNIYGPTETTTAVLADEVPPGGEPCLGRPIAGAVLSIRDDDGRPVADGESGELWIAGPGVGTGYLHRPELTAQRYVERDGRRHYRTGDLIRHHDDRYAFVGRRDDQVKVRGFRVEPGEVQAALAGHPDVRSAVVLAPVDPYGTRRLVGYVEPSAPVTEPELTGYLRERLPGFMVPSRIAVLDRLPLGPTGKVDRAALPEVEFARADDEAYVAPQGDTEAGLARLVAGVLGVSRVGRHDRFTELGGHSLAAARLLARVADEHGVAVPLGRFLGAPTVAELARELAPDRARPVPVREHRDRHPLTDMQRVFWMLRQVTGTPWASTVGLRLAVTGLVDVEQLRAALAALVVRHESLRTRILDGDDGPYAVVSPPVPVPVTELTDRDGATGRAGTADDPSTGDGPTGSAAPGRRGDPRPDDERRRLAAGFAAQPFELAGDVPMIRVGVLWTGPDRAELAIAVDHTGFDGVSIGVLMRDLAVALAAVRAGTDPVAALPPLPVQVSDVAVADERARSGAGPAVERFWESTLDGVVPPYDLPGKPRRGPSRHAGRRVVRPIDSGLRAGIAALGERDGLTPYAMWAAALVVLLDGLTGRPDTLLGVAAANRDRPGLDRLIGALMDVLPVRVDCADDPSFAGLAARVAANTAQVLAHRDVAVGDLPRLTGVVRPLGAGLTPVVLSVQPEDLPMEVTEDGGTVRLLGELDTAAAQNELTVYVNAGADGPELHVEYDTDRFEAADGERMADRLLRLLGAAVAEPDRPVSTLPLLDDAERSWLLRVGDGGPVPAQTPPTVLPAIFARAAATPEAVAVVGPAGTLDYAGLAAHAERVAAHLVALGAGPDAPVGVCLPRDHLLPATLLGVLRAGSAYLPLEPDQPVDRLRHQATEGGVRLVLVTPATTAAVAGLPGVRLVDVTAVPAAAGVPLPPMPTADSLAYVLYTSGSTGRPKGVEVTHGNLAGYLAAMRDDPGYGPADVFLAVAPLSFDLSCFELWLALMVGARTVVVGRDTAVDGPALAARVEATGVTAMLVTPSTLRLMLAAGWRGGPEVRVISGGEPLDAGLADELTKVVGQLFDGYGPTEATVLVTCHPIPPGIAGPVPIGGPIRGARLYVLDRAGRLAPPGVVGELWIGGAGVARGYRNRPDLSAAAFDTDPYAPGGRRYRTGDLARWRPDGVLDYLGRRDTQVKLRGYRIELEEIETVLRSHPAVADAAVTIVEPGGPDAYLAAYLVGDPGLDPESVAGHARSRLPGYMVPPRWTVLDRLPLTTAGKVDRAALPAPAGPTAPPAPPRTEMEKFVAELWAVVLDRPEVGRDDDFFAVGGHSLAATRLTGRLREQLGCDIAVPLLFQHPRLADYAARVEELVLADLAALDDQADLDPSEPVEPARPVEPAHPGEPAGGAGAAPPSRAVPAPATPSPNGAGPVAEGWRR